MVLDREDILIVFKECQLHDRETLTKFHTIADDLIEHVERSHELRKLFGNLLREAVQLEIESIQSQHRISKDEVHRQMILFSMDLLCRYLIVLENLIISNDLPNNTLGTPNSKKQKRSNQTCHLDWLMNERDEILHLFTNLIQLDLRQFWHESERLEDQEIGSTIIDVCLTIIRNNQYSSRARTVKDYLSFILAVAIGLFRLEEETSMKMIQMLQIQEHTASIFSAVIICHVKHFRTDSLLERTINDICHLCLSSNHLQSSISNNSFRSNSSTMNNQTETNNSRTMAKLLDELSIHLSDHLILYINRLLDLFDSDCLQMRNSLLNICVNIIRYCSSLAEYKELRGELFLLIIDQYFLDCNVHVRSHAIGLCQTLVESKLIPTKFYCHLTESTIERMNDTSCIVRKNAIQLATKLLKNNPYTDRFLPIDSMLDEYNGEMNKLVQLQKLLGQALDLKNLSNDSEKIQESQKENDLDNQHLLFEKILEQKQRVASLYSIEEFLPSFEIYNREMSILMQMQSKLNNCLQKNVEIENIDDEEQIERATRLFDTMVKQSKLVSYLHNATEFCNLFRKFLAKDALCLLSSKVNSDVLETIEFLVLWSNFECRSTVYRKLEQNLFSLIWSNDKNISNAVINAFKRICLKIDEENQEEKISSKQIIEKLLDQIDSNLNLTFEQILKYLFNESTLTANEISSFIDLLLDYYLRLTIDQSKKHLSDEFFKQIQQRQCSFLQLIGFVIPYDRKHRLASEFQSIVRNLHRQIDRKDLNYFRYQMEIVSNLMTNKISPEILNDFLGAMMKKLLDSPIEFPLKFWINSMKQMMNIIFQRTSNIELVDPLAMNFLRSLAEQIHWPSDGTDSSNRFNDSSYRTRFIRILTSVNALLTNRVQQLECRTSSSLSKISKENQQSKSSNEDQSHSIEFSNSTTINDEENENEELDDHHEIPSNKQSNSDLSHLEKEILHEKSLFSTIEKWIEIFLYENHSETDEQLVLNCISTCTRMMYVSPILCSKYVDRIFDLSKTSPYSSVRSALIVSLGDLLLRHPNIIEPFTPQFYAQIHDTDLNVGETALCTIAILILREMIKVRGYISEIALCLFHPHTPIASIAQHFFDELSLRQRGLALFNVLPDIISRLSMNNICSIDSFQQIISHLFSFIKNDRHCEILVKRLCRQFKQASGEDRKRGNIAFCLSKLNIRTMASYRILKENFPTIMENNQETIDDDDQEEYLAWRRYLLPVLNDIERRLKPNEVNTHRRQSSATTPKRKQEKST